MAAVNGQMLSENLYPNLKKFQRNNF
jgi:hypothetical protein